MDKIQIIPDSHGYELPNITNTFQMQIKALGDSIIAPSPDPAASPESLQYESILRSIAKYPRYQHMLVVVITIFWVLITFNAMIGSFVFMNPLFQCGGVGKTEAEACVDIDQCRITNNFTAVVKNGLYCTKSNIRATVQSIFALGLTIGMVIMPISSDIFGRRKVIIAIYGVGVLAMSMLVLAIENDIEILMIGGSMLTGIFGSGMTILGFILTCDFCQEKLRQRSLLLYCSFWGLTEMTFYLLYFYMPEWDRYLLYCLLVPTGVMFVFLLFWKLESPAYAIFRRKDVRIWKEVMGKLGRFNRMPQDKIQQLMEQGNKIISTLKSVHKEQPLLTQTLKKIAQNKSSLISCLCLTITLISFNFFYYGMQGSMQRIGQNFGMSMLLVGLNQFLAYLSASYVTKFLRRKKGAIVAIVFTSGVGLLFLLHYVKESQAWQTVLAVIARIGSVYAYCFILLLQSQLLQVQIRATAVAIIVSIGQISRIAVPYLINSLNNAGIHPIIVSSFLFILLGAAPILALKETLKKNMEGKKGEGKEKLRCQEVDVVNE